MIAELVKCLTNWYDISKIENQQWLTILYFSVFRLVSNQSDEFSRIIKLKLNNWSSNSVIDLAAGVTDFVTFLKRFGLGFGNTHITYRTDIKSSFNILPLNTKNIIKIFIKINETNRKNVLNDNKSLVRNWIVNRYWINCTRTNIIKRWTGFVHCTARQHSFEI